MHLLALLKTGRNLAERIPYSLIALASRIAVATVFWRRAPARAPELRGASVS